MNSLLVIGGSGFFGKSILDAYKRGLLETFSINKIYIFARNAEALKFTNPELLCDSVVLVNGDITSCEEVPFAEFVIHAATSTDASKYINAPESEKKNILAGTLNFCKLANLYLKESKILYVSSGAVYGASSSEMLPFSEGDDFISAEKIPEAKRPYAVAKRDSETEIIKNGKRGLRVAIARCFAFIGKYLPRDQHFAIGNFIQNGIDKQPILINSKSRVYRSYMHADDLVFWLLTILSKASSDCPIYNVGSSEAVEIRDLGVMISKYYSVDFVMQPLSNSPSDFYIPTIEKAERELGLSCSHGLLEVIELTDRQINAT